MNKRHCVRGSEPITLQDIRQLILSAMPGSKVEVFDMTGTNDHFEIHVASREFKDLSLMDQHKKIFTILGKEMEDRIHAVKLKTKVS